MKKEKEKAKLKLKQEKAKKAIEKKKKNEEKLAMAGIPDKLENTGIEAMKISDLRSAHRLDRHFTRARRNLWKVESRTIKKLQRSEGGTAARHAAMALRRKAKEAVRAREIVSIKRAIANEKQASTLKERQIRDDYARQFRELERHDMYAQELQKLVGGSWWHGMYTSSLASAHSKCDDMSGDEYAACMQHVQHNSQWLARSLRAKDSDFQAAYKSLSTSQAAARQSYLDKRDDLAYNYQDALDGLHADVQTRAARREMEIQSEVRKRMEVNGGSDLGGDLEDQAMENAYGSVTPKDEADVTATPEDDMAAGDEEGANADSTQSAMMDDLPRVQVDNQIDEDGQADDSAKSDPDTEIDVKPAPTADPGSEYAH